MKRSRLTLSVFTAALCSFLLLASSAMAGTPSTVTVRVVGLTGTTLLPQTQVTTTSAPIDPDGNPSDTCTGTSAAGALDDAVRGNWVVLYEGGNLGYQIDGIQGLNFPAFSSDPDAYWSFWLDNVPSSVGACGAELSQGDEVVFFAECYQQGTDCPTGAIAPEHLLTETASPSSVQVGAPVSVTVGSLNTETGSAESSLPSGTTVTAGSISALTTAQGVATLTFPKTGIYTIEAAAPDSVPSAPQTVCVHNGNDGNCGTTLISGGEPTKSTTTLVQAPETIVSYEAKVEGVKNGHVYSRRSAPRLLSGVVDVPTGGALHQVRISLQRRYHGRCFDFSGSRESFVRRKKCGSSAFFSVGGSESFSYLLPARLPKGSYVYEIEAINNAGQATKLVSGVSHVVFQVK